uniref:Uncharacterized protein n=1 Tax=Cacopsylla melanoneura TaxID=428564 RepID=A0A8D9BHG9_9HEMI
MLRGNIVNISVGCRIHKIILNTSTLCRTNIINSYITISTLIHYYTYTHTLLYLHSYITIPSLGLTPLGLKPLGRTPLFRISSEIMSNHRFLGHLLDFVKS